MPDSPHAPLSAPLDWSGFYLVREAALRLGISTEYARRLAERGTLEYITLPTGALLLGKASVDRLVAERAVRRAAKAAQRASASS
jgi:predicted site-specific integrase-resolvase